VEDKDEDVVSQAMGEVRVLFSSVLVWELEALMAKAKEDESKPKRYNMLTMR
jgi:hypothetical protein